MATKRKDVPEVPAVDRAITLWQPYASLLLAGLKTYETRSWPLSKPGWIAVHAARSEPTEVRQRIAQPRRCFAHCLKQMGAAFEDLPRGAVIGLAHFGPSVRVEEVWRTIGAQDADFGDWTDGRWAWPVLDVWPFPEPVPARGMQGIWRWNMPPDLSDAFAQHWLDSQRRVRR